MNIKDELRKRLLNEGSGGHDYGCVMLFLPIEKKWWKSITDEIKEEDVYKPEGERDYGIQPSDETHVTILYGCLPSVTDENVEEVLSSEGKPKLKIGGLSLFENDDFDVVKFDVSSNILNKLNEKMKEYPYTNTYDTYEPHITVAYVKKGCGKKAIEDIGDISDIDFKPSHYIYSKPNGDKVRFEIKED